MSEPRFLASLDRPSRVAPGHWVAHCPVFGCADLLEITVVDGEYRFECDGEHTHHDIASYLALDDLRAEEARAIGRRAYVALMLSPTPEVWSQLLLGEEVPEDQLDREYLARMRARRVA